MQQLGDAMTIKQVAKFVGCSSWTVRNKLVPAGLPHFRSSPSGKLTFFHEQVVAWVLARQNQTKGEMCIRDRFTTLSPVSVSAAITVGVLSIVAVMMSPLFLRIHSCEFRVLPT